jgi:hypothetical protein
MAKEQDVPLNPAKISGVCGRLLCCLAFEHEYYRALRGQLPKIGQTVSTPAGDARLIAVSIPREVVTLQMLDTFATLEMPMEELRKQYGVVVRPTELEGTVGKAEASAEASGVEEPAEAKPAETAAETAKDRSRRRHRRRNGRGRKRGKNGPSAQ